MSPTDSIERPYTLTTSSRRPRGYGDYEHTSRRPRRALRTLLAEDEGVRALVP